MQKIVVELETITPLFLGGADPEGEPELRSPSLRGALRYWTRALLGGIYGDDPRGLKKLREKETDIWGNTMRGSSVVCQVHKKGQEANEPQNLKANMSPGESYLLWAAKERKCFCETKIEISIKPRIGSRMSDENYRIAVASFWLLIHLGGLGTRSRRLMGSLKVNNAINWPAELPAINIECAEPEALAKTLSILIKQWRDLLGIDANAIFSPQSEYDIFYPDHCSIFVWNKKWNSIDDLINYFGVDFQTKRLRLQPDYQAVKDVIHGVKTNTKLSRPGFGLPLQFFYRSEYDQLIAGHPEAKNDKAKRIYLRNKVSATLEPAHPDINRRASPVHFHVEPLRGNNYTIIATFFESRFLPNNTLIRVKPKDKTKKEASLEFEGYSQVITYLRSQKPYELDLSSGGIKS